MDISKLENEKKINVFSKSRDPSDAVFIFHNEIVGYTPVKHSKLTYVILHLRAFCLLKLFHGELRLDVFSKKSEYLILFYSLAIRGGTQK
jgi:hypothetical protein